MTQYDILTLAGVSGTRGDSDPLNLLSRFPGPWGLRRIVDGPGVEYKMAFRLVDEGGEEFEVGAGSLHTLLVFAAQQWRRRHPGRAPEVEEWLERNVREEGL